ncbi:MAG: translesion error-prone DNA polymerase V autoproteolytic subunit [Victivallales bacterium]|nr:translesion error-prone DNA polymerase V autoproteolytic subunit [Victivallales bacterium]
MKRQEGSTLGIGQTPADFPSTAENDAEGQMDLNSVLVYRPAATFFVRVQGDSMIGAGIHSGDILVVDKSLDAKDGSIVIAELEGDFLVKQFCRRKDGSAWLVPTNPRFQPINVTGRTDFNIWGIVTANIHQFVRERVRK